MSSVFRHHLQVKSIGLPAHDLFHLAQCFKIHSDWVKSLRYIYSVQRPRHMDLCCILVSVNAAAANTSLQSLLDNSSFISLTSPNREMAGSCGHTILKILAISILFFLMALLTQYCENTSHNLYSLWHFLSFTFYILLLFTSHYHRSKFILWFFFFHFSNNECYQA